MDITAEIAKWVLGLAFIFGGLIYAALIYIADGYWVPNSAKAWLPIILCLGVAVLGGLILRY